MQHVPIALLCSIAAFSTACTVGDVSLDGSEPIPEGLDARAIGAGDASRFVRTVPGPNGTPFEIGIDLDVPGNVRAESTSNMWPLSEGRALRYYGQSDSTGEDYGRLQIRTGGPSVYEGHATYPVDFIKDRVDLYWGPSLDLNLRWHVVASEQTEEDYVWARGDERYDRSALPNIVRTSRFRYDSLSRAAPPYALWPKQLGPNPANEGLVNAVTARHHYSSCNSASGGDCDVVARPSHNTWFMGVRNAKIKVPHSGNEWVDAKWVEYIELELPGNDADDIHDPYSADREFACRRLASGERYYKGVREDWFFVPGLGPALILQRHVGIWGQDDCVYEVVREAPSFDVVDNYSYLIEADNRGYQPDWE